ncbi:MAG: ABC transporter ATP-binding protein [Limisphaerales bacterium]|jgi:oligopeptide/dipeptide ABC transporter ATP-binding protein
MPLLELRDLHIHFGATPAVDGVSLSLEEGRTLCLVGESGCGKSITALSIARLLPMPPAHYPRGEILVDGQDVLRMPSRQLQRIRGGTVGYVFQEPGASLNPVLRVGTQIREALELHRPEAATEAEVLRLLRLVGIPAPESRIRDYPHQLSGGMAQRVMIAMGLASQPRLLIADEPTTALDVTVQAQIIELLKRLQGELGMAILLITHNLGLVTDIGDRVAVMYAGRIVEEGPASEILTRPRHPYTRALLRSVPELGRATDRLASIPGTVPSLGQWPTGCRFAPRCPEARPECGHHMPELQEITPGRTVRCPFSEP